MPAGAPPSSPGPRSSGLVAPSAPVAMTRPPPTPPAAAEDEVRLLPPIKMKLLFPYAVHCAFGGMDRAWGMALVGIQTVVCIIKVLSFTTDAEEARFWIPIFRVWVAVCIAAMVLMTCVEIIRYYMPVDGVYVVKFDPQQQQPAAAAGEQLPPPPPEMDMC